MAATKTVASVELTNALAAGAGVRVTFAGQDVNAYEHHGHLILGRNTGLASLRIGEGGRAYARQVLLEELARLVDEALAEAFPEVPL